MACQEDAAIGVNSRRGGVLPLALKRATVREAIHRLRRDWRISLRPCRRAVELAERGTTGDSATLTEGLLLTVEYGHAFTIADESHEPPLPDGRSPNWTRVTLGSAAGRGLPGSDWALDADIVTAGPGLSRRTLILVGLSRCRRMLRVAHVCARGGPATASRRTGCAGITPS